MTSIVDPARTIAEWCLAEQVVFAPPAPEPHMGCIIADAALQAGLRYKTVVLPRVNRLREQFPDAITVSRFLDVAAKVGMEVLLDWTHPVKVERARALALSLQSNGVDSVAELAAWWVIPRSQAILMTVPGIGSKQLNILVFSPVHRPQSPLMCIFERSSQNKPG